MTSYEKLKYIVRKLLKGESISKNLEDLSANNISNDTYAKFITKLNDIKLLQTISKGENTVQDNYFNKTYFFDLEKNASIIASIAHLERKIIKVDIIKYLFKLVPNNLLFTVNNKFTRNFDNNILPLLDTDKYYYFKNIIATNTSSSKSICQIFNTKKSILELIIPLELFIYDSSWYVCYYDYKSKNVLIVDSLEISESYLLDEAFHEFIDENKINSAIKFYVNDLTILEEPIFLRLKPETLNLLLEFKLIDEFKIYNFINKNYQFNFCKQDKVEILSNSQKYILQEIDYFKLSQTNNKINIQKSMVFMKQKSRHYMIKIKCSQTRLEYILNKFPSIERVDKLNIEFL
jgi:hypothetical protein